MVIYSDTVGCARATGGSTLADLALPSPLHTALAATMPASTVLTQAQVGAWAQDVVNAPAHFVIAAPTNSGKTLVALLRIFVRLLVQGGRFVYVAPLKALAEQKTRELTDLAAAIAVHGGRRIKVSISTGDYRVSGDLPDAPPEDAAEILVCTPERLDVLLRNPRNHAWAASVDTYVLDEFHVLGQALRGARYDAMVTRLLMACPLSRLLVLSATIGSLDIVVRWLGASGMPVRLVESSARAPALRRTLLQVEDKDVWIEAHAADVLRSPQRSLLVFVYRQADATRLARRIAEALGQPHAVAAFHSAMQLADKQACLAGFQDGCLRILVCTTSLALGINSPATDVVVRDTVFFGHGRLQPSDILQITGRAGRGHSTGEAFVLFGERESSQSLMGALRAGTVEPLAPHLIPPAQSLRFRRAPAVAEASPQLATALLAEVAARGTARLPDLKAFLKRTYAAAYHDVPAGAATAGVESLLRDKLVYAIENSEDEIAATKLGRTVSYAGLSAMSGALLGAFLRALINLSEKEGQREAGLPTYLERMAPLDFLALCLATHEARPDVLARSFRPDERALSEYIELLPPEEKPLLHLWRDPGSATHPTRRLLTTLRIDAQEHSHAYVQLLTAAAALHDFSRSRLTPAEIGAKWNLQVDLEGRLLPVVEWMLNGVARICTGEQCYKLDFLLPRLRALGQDLAVGGGFGVLLDVEGVGLRTIERIKEGGYRSLHELGRPTVEELTRMGVRGAAATKIVRLLNRRAR